MIAIGEGIAYAGLCLAAAWLEITGKGAGLLWVFVVFWALFTDWGEAGIKRAEKAKARQSAKSKAQGGE